MNAPIRTSLKQRAFKAGTWSFAGLVISQAIRFGTNLLMTRLLAPEMFGVMAIANMVITGLAMISDIGLQPSVVQSKRGSEPVFLNTVWVTQICRSLLLWVLALAICALLVLVNTQHMVPLKSVYADPVLPQVLAVISVTVLIAGLQSTKLFEAGRNLSIGSITKNAIVAQVVGVAVMIGWVLIDRSIWALVAGALVSSVVTTFLSHVTLPGVSNRWQWDSTAFWEIFHFGKWIFGSSLLGFVALNSDRFLLAGFIDSTMLGVYVVAFFIVATADHVVTKLMAEVSFPAFSEIARERRQQLATTYYQVYTLAVAFAYFCAGGLFVSGHVVISILYDERYHQAGWMLEILGLTLVSVPIRVAVSCLMALGYSRSVFHVISLRAISAVILIPLAYKFFGLQGALWAIVVSYLSPLPLTLFYMIKQGMFDIRKEVMLLPIFIVGMIAGKCINWILGYF